MTISQSEGVETVRVGLFGVAIVLLLPLGPAGSVVFLLLSKYAEVIVQALEAFLPVPAVMFEPVIGGLEGGCLEAAGTPLGLAPAGDEPGSLQDLEMLGDGGKGHLERGSDLADRGLTGGKALEDGTPRWVRQGGEGGANGVGRKCARHGYLTTW